MSALSAFIENMLIDGLLRGGAVNSAGTVNSTAVVTGVWAATTAYTLGQVVAPPSTFTAGGGKFLRCTTAGTTGSTTTLACPAIGSTLTDGTVTWTAVSGMPSLLNVYAALFAINKGLRASSTAYSTGDCISLTATGGAGGDTKQHVYRCTTAGTTAGSQPGTYLGVPGEAITDGTAVFTEITPVLQSNTGFPAGLTEVSSGSYARQPITCSLTALAGTQGLTTTTASSGTGGPTGGTTANNAAITFPSPTANWASGSAMVGVIALFDQLTAGNQIVGAALSVPKTINNGDAAPSFAISALTIQIDN